MIIKTLILILAFHYSYLIYGQQSTRFMVVGDTHYNSPTPNFNESILYELSLAAIQEEVDFVFFTGDLVLRDLSGNIDSLLSDWRFILDTLYANSIKVYACRGNNDVASQVTWSTLFSGIHALPDNGPEEEKYYTYSFEYDNFLFISLDEYTQYERINQGWLNEQLINNNKPYVFVAGHEPAFKLLHPNCLAAYPAERDTFWNSLTQHNGIIYFCGHDHFYDHSIIPNEDGNSFNDVHQIIVGTGGGGIHPDDEYNGDNGEWSPVRIFHDSTYGYVLVEVNGTSLTTMWKHRTDTNLFEEGGDTYSYTLTSITENKIEYNYYLSQNYPNPFNPHTIISYQLPVISNVTLKIYDILGSEVATLVNGEKDPGIYQVQFDGTNLASGIYIFRLKTDSYSSVKKMILLK
jgi:predicted phosphodiesterase